MIFNSGSSRRLMWRAGRYLYRRARGEVANNIETNGEAYVQASVLAGAGTSKMPLTVFDVGANLGEWARLFLSQIPAQLISSARILMFEPVPATYDKLKVNISQFENGHVAQAYPLAMSNQAGEAEMVVLSETGGTNSLHFDENLAISAIGCAKIEKTTLDAFCKSEGIEHINLLKCDTEGHDAHALFGAREMLHAGRLDVAQFEYNHRWVYARSYLKDMFDLIEDLPYRIARICSNHIEVFEAWHFELERFFEANYLIVHESVLSWFDARCGVFDESNTYA